MNITPDTNIRLLKCPLELDNKNQITFSNATTQYNYFSSLTYIEVDGSMYQRKDSSIYYPALYDDLVGYTYVMYQNSNYSNKWFYAYITNMEYINDNTTRIEIVTDVFQTWQFDLVYKASYVEREMINIASDTPGANLLPEGLEGGEYKVGGTAEINDLNPVNVWAYSSNNINILGTDHQILQPIPGGAPSPTMFVNGLPTSLVYLVTTTELAYAAVAWSLEGYGNQSEYVIAHFTVPYTAVNGIMNDLYNPYSGLSVVYGTSAATTQSLVSTPTSLDGYTPVNAKLRTYPYMYVAFNPSQGSSKVFRYEDFTSGTPSFKIISEVNPNPTVYFIPQNYRGASGDSMSDIVSLNGYPQLSSKVDVYNSWLAENSGIINVQTNQNYSNSMLDIYQNTGNLIGNILGLAVSGGNRAVSGLSSVANTALGMEKTAINYDYYIAQVQAQKERQALLPDNVTLGGSNATLLGYGLFNDNIFTRYTIKYQFAKRIDDYFSMYGYQTNELKVPNINNRPYWNYVKTLGINLIGTIPQEDLETIKNIFNNGVTLWHNTSYFLDYKKNNKEI